MSRRFYLVLTEPDSTMELKETKLHSVDLVGIINKQIDHKNRYICETHRITSWPERDLQRSSNSTLCKKGLLRSGCSGMDLGESLMLSNMKIK